MTQPSDAREERCLRCGCREKVVVIGPPFERCGCSLCDALVEERKRREEELARLQSALTQKNGEPKWSRGFRVIDGKTCEIIEGVIAKADYDALQRREEELLAAKAHCDVLAEHAESFARERDALKAQHEAAVRELGLVKQNERLAIQALTEAQRGIERWKDMADKEHALAVDFAKGRETAEAQVRMLRETAHAVNCDCRVSKGSMDDFKTWDDPRCLARREALATPPASQPTTPGSA